MVNTRDQGQFAFERDLRVRLLITEDPRRMLHRCAHTLFLSADQGLRLHPASWRRKDVLFISRRGERAGLRVSMKGRPSNSNSSQVEVKHQRST